MASDRGSGTLTGAGVGVIVWFGSGVPVEYYSVTVPGSLMRWPSLCTLLLLGVRARWWLSPFVRVSGIAK